MLGYTIVEIRKEDMAQSPVLHRNRLHIGNRLALLCRLLHDGKAGIVFLAHRVGNQYSCRHGTHRQPQSPCGQNLLSMFSEIAANQRLPQNGNRRNDNHSHRTKGCPGREGRCSNHHEIVQQSQGQHTARITHSGECLPNISCFDLLSQQLDNRRGQSQLLFDQGVNKEDGQPVKKKEQATDYGKIAKAIGEIIGDGIKISLVDINKSDYGFKPDVKNNQILFGMKALNGVGSPIIEQIKENRPYVSFKDFLNRCPLNKTAMISLIKAGAFDNLEQDTKEKEARIFIMAYYLSLTSEPKKKLNLQNFSGLINLDLIPQELSFQKRVFNFNKYLKAYKWKEDDINYYYIPHEYAIKFYLNNFDPDTIDKVSNGIPMIEQKNWEKIYQKVMDTARDWLKENQQQLLKEVNQKLFKAEWDKYAMGNISAWEMSSLCFYYHDHELKNINNRKYGIVDFNNLPVIPEVDYFFKRNGVQIPIYKLCRIAGTVIGKNDTRHSVVLLTTSGVVNVKLTRDYYAMFNRQISEVNDKGEKKVKEKGWFTRGTKLLVTGYRRDDTFVAKKYKSTGGHQLYKIIEVAGKNISLTATRYGMEENNE